MPLTDEQRRALWEALTDAAAWGMAYGPSIPGHQWNECRDGAVKVRFDILVNKLERKQ